MTEIKRGPFGEPGELNDDRLLEFEARAVARSQGPWVVRVDGDRFGTIRVARNLDHEMYDIRMGSASYCAIDLEDGLGRHGPAQDIADARFIEAAHSIGPELCVEVRRLRCELAALKGKLERTERSIAEAQQRAKSAGRPDPMVDQRDLEYVNWDDDLGEAIGEPPAVRLYSLMSGISEGRWCAGWLGGLEFWLWSTVEKGLTSDGSQQGSYPTPAELALLKSLSAEVGGWLVWESNLAKTEAYPETDSRLSGARLVPMADWLAMYAKGDPAGSAPSGEEPKP